MALEVGHSSGATLVNGTNTPSPAEEEELYDQLLRLRDAVVAGKHTSLRLPASAIELLKATQTAPDAHAVDSRQPYLNGTINGSAFATNHSQSQQSLSFPTFSGLPGLQHPPGPFSAAPSQTYGKKSTTGLDPIFLEKSESLVRAEGQLKRQRLERDLQVQLDQRKHSSRDKDPGADAPSPIDIDGALARALERVKPISGLKVAEKAGSAASSSFDENDYYSSQVQSEWSSEASSSKGSDRAAGAFTGDFERLDGGPQASSSRAKRSAHGKQPAAQGASFKEQRAAFVDDDEDTYEPEDADDDYMPPDATAFDSSREQGPAMGTQRVPPPEDDDSDYEPGEIAQDSNYSTSNYQAKQPAQTSPRVQVVRNHLTHIAAPQPNRVSPLATAKGPSIELELVNGRPEVVQKPTQRPHYAQSRVSTASPSANGISGSGKKRRNKKRKRDNEPTGRAKRRHIKQNVIETPASPVNQEPYIKDEPVSPPPFSTVPQAPSYSAAYPQQYRPQAVETGIASPIRAPQLQYVTEAPRSGLRYEYDRPAVPTAVRAASPLSQRTVQKDTQDLRRVASLQHAQRPPSRQQRPYSPVGPYITASMTFRDPGFAQPVPPSDDIAAPRYTEQVPAQEEIQYVHTERSRSPPRSQQYRDPYAERASPALMPPPPVAPPRRIIQDQYGRRYYAAEEVPAPSYVPRASVVPIERRQQHEMPYERAPSHASAAYPQSAGQPLQYEPVDDRMAPPPQPARRQPAPESQIEYVDANGYRVREYSSRPLESPRYAPEPTSPVYQQMRGYEQMPPPAPPAREPTSPVYVSRSYSVRPEEPQPIPSSYVRQASMAPVQYVRQEAPPPQARAVSVMPNMDYGNQVHPPQRTYSYAPQAVRYVNQYGEEVFPREVNELRYQ
ncbi:hypothetical protein LTR37_002909 [Vermiconidia calcicola]|uniref:Uncharacterized protein n=1 Tax=Vermiconidia calcicola TaxID=1690605 RepID=A0ACC3NSJ6_9PEZI|nr:hypothetical protein LTR37_002909 [Vermiconidia calcicola]